MAAHLKFKSAEKDFFNCLQERVNAYFKEKSLSKDGGTILIIKSILLFISFIVPFFLIIFWQPPTGVTVLLLVLMGMGKAGVGMSVMHDALHGALSKKKWVNNLFGGSLYLLGGNPINWQIQHNVLHHTYPNVYKVDEDVSTKGFVLRLSPESEYHKVHRFQWLYILPLYGLMTLSFIVKDFRQLYRYNISGETERQGLSPAVEMTKLVITKLLYFAMMIALPLSITDYSLTAIITGFAIVHFVAGLILSIVFQLAHIVEETEHPERNSFGGLDTSWAIHQLITTSNFAPGSRLIHWFTGGLNFQVEHHLFPHISHIHYRSIAPIVKKTAEEFGIVYNSQPTLWSAFVSHIKMLRALGKSQRLELV